MAAESRTTTAMRKTDLSLLPANCLAGSPLIVLLGRVEDFMDSFERNGWATLPGWLDRPGSLRLTAECGQAREQGGFTRAGVGRGEQLTLRDGIRTDHILWLEPGTGSVEQDLYLARLETLRLAFNRRFFLGLSGFEGHFAIYPEGAFYKAHLDRHAGTRSRILTAILYLNPDWQPGDGGELKLQTTPGEKDGTFEMIEPRLGTLVCFLAADFWHEVMPAVRTRMSITGWFSER